MGKATEEALDNLHGELAKQLAEKIKDGTATAADMAVARQFLKDNGIEARPKKGQPLADLADALPYPDADGIAEDHYQH